MGYGAVTFNTPANILITRRIRGAQLKALVFFYAKEANFGANSKYNPLYRGSGFEMRASNARPGAAEA